MSVFDRYERAPDPYQRGSGTAYRNGDRIVCPTVNGGWACYEASGRKIEIWPHRGRVQGARSAVRWLEGKEVELELIPGISFPSSE